MGDDDNSLGAAAAAHPPTETAASDAGGVLCVSMDAVDDALPVDDAHREQDERALSSLFGQRAGDSDHLLAFLIDTKPASSASATTSPVEPPPKRRIKKRRYQEVLHLRETASTLEQELTTLKSRQDSAVRPPRKDEDVSNPTLRWQKAAKREIQATTRARLENTKLRETVAAHVEFAKSLRQVLVTKHRSIESLQRYFLSDHGELVVAWPNTPRESTIYDTLMKNVCARVCDSSDLLRASGLSSLTDLVVTSQQEATISEVRILLNEEQALCIDLIDRHIIPFDYKAGARVLWANVLSKNLKVAVQATHVSLFEWLQFYYIAMIYIFLARCLIFFFLPVCCINTYRLK